MTVSKTTKAAAPAPEYDFDNWSDADEEKAVAELVPDVKHIIVEKRFIGRFPDGEIVELPLTLSVDDVDELEGESSNPVDQLKHLLTKIGGATVAAKFTKHDLVETTIMARRFFTIFERIAKASIPE